jgi:SnoaL-like protein
MNRRRGPGALRRPSASAIDFDGRRGSVEDTRHEEDEMTDEQQIRALTERWAVAVGDGDLDGVLARHDPGIVMFDVSPPNEGVRGIEAYRQTWPPFFEWLASGAVFQNVHEHHSFPDTTSSPEASAECHDR